jgi:phage shock protein C
MLLGVAGGLAEYMDVDPTVVRIGFVLLALLSGTGIVLYIILALIMPAPETV